MKVNPFVIIFLLSLSFNGLFGYLSYNFYSQKVVLQEQLKDVKEKNKQLEESVQKEQNICEIQDEVVSSYNEDNKKAQDTKEDILKEVDVLINKDASKKTMTGKADEESNYAELDESLSPDTIKLLERVHNSVQR